MPTPYTFINDTLAGTAGTYLSQPAGNTDMDWTAPDGTFWIYHTSGANYIGPVFATTGGVTGITSLASAYGSGLTSVVYATTCEGVNTARTPEYDPVYRLYQYGAYGVIGICARFQPQTGNSSTAAACYKVQYDASTGVWTLFRVGGSGSPVTLGTYTAAITTNSYTDVEFRCRDARKSVYLNGVERIFDTSDNVISYPGTVAVTMKDCAGQGGAGTYGLLLHSISASGPDDSVRRTYLLHHYDVMPLTVLSSPITASASGNWADTGTWTGGTVPTTEDVWIPAGVTVTISGSASARHVQVEGTLTFDVNSTTSLTCRTVYVTPEGTLLMGDVNSPVAAGHTCTVTIADAAIDTTNDPSQYGHGIVCCGKWRAYGQTKTPFVRCSTELTASQTSVTLSTAPVGWNNGDVLLFPDSRQLNTSTELYDSYTPHFDDAKTVSSLSGTALTLSAGLTYAHPGAKAADGTLLYTPHVANMTRNVVLQSANPSGTRGHVLVFSDADVEVGYVQVKDFGRTLMDNLDNTTYDSSGCTVTHVGTNQIAKYAFHFHHTHGTDAASRYQFEIVGSVVDNTASGGSHKVKWGIDIHDSHWGLCQGNVVYNTCGYAIGFEDGNESYNVIDGNFAVRDRGYGLRVSDDLNQAVGVGREGCGFWLRNANNWVRNNVATGVTQMTGHANPYVYGYIFGMYQLYGGYVPSAPGRCSVRPSWNPFFAFNNTPILEFNNNEAYGAMESGITMWWVGRYSTQLTEPVGSADTPVYNNFVANRAGEHISRNYTEQPWSYIDNFICWNYWDAVCFVYEVYRLAFHNLTAICDNTLLTGGHGSFNGIFHSDYPATSFAIEESRFENMPQAWSLSSNLQAGELYHCDVRCPSVINSESPWSSGSDANVISARDARSVNVLWDTTNISSPVRAYQRRYVLSDGATNLVVGDSMHVQDYNQSAGTDYDVFYTQQASSQVMPQTNGTSLVASPNVGKTNAQNLADNGVCIANKIATCTTTSTTITDGYYCTLNDFAERALSSNAIGGGADVSGGTFGTPRPVSWRGFRGHNHARHA